MLPANQCNLQGVGFFYFIFFGMALRCGPCFWLLVVPGAWIVSVSACVCTRIRLKPQASLSVMGAMATMLMSTLTRYHSHLRDKK